MKYMDIIFLQNEKLIEQNMGGMLFDMLQDGNLRLEYFERSALGDKLYKIRTLEPYSGDSPAYDYLWRLANLRSGLPMGNVAEVIEKRQNSSRVLRYGRKECREKYCFGNMFSHHLTDEAKQLKEREFSRVEDTLNNCDSIEKYSKCCQLAYHFFADKKIREELSQMPAQEVSWCDIPLDADDIYKATATMMDIGFVNGAVYGAGEFSGEIARPFITGSRRG